jgi:hypothetical protein
VALQRNPSHSEWPRVAPLPASQDQTERYEPGQDEVFVSLYFEFASTIAICGSKDLAEFCNRRTQLDRLIDTCHELGGAEPLAQRFVGSLECCLIRRRNIWTDLTAETERRLVIGLDFRRARIYAFRCRDNGAKDEISYADITASGAPLAWKRLCGLPNGAQAASYLDASHFVPGERGPCAIIRLLNSRGNIEHRLLTIEETARQIGSIPVDRWSDAMSKDFSVFRPDRRSALGEHGRSQMVTGLLVEKHEGNGVRIERHVMKYWPVPAYAYFEKEMNRIHGLHDLPPVLQP